MGCSFLPFAKDLPAVAYVVGYALARLVGYFAGALLGSAPMTPLWALEAKPFRLAFSICASTRYCNVLGLTGYAPGMRWHRNASAPFAFMCHLGPLFSQSEYTPKLSQWELAKRP